MRLGQGSKGSPRSDAVIFTEVAARLARFQRLDLSEVEVRVEGARVTLRGHVSDLHQKRIAGDIVQSVAGVVHVHNLLRAGGPSALHPAYDDL